MLRIDLETEWSEESFETPQQNPLKSGTPGSRKAFVPITAHKLLHRISMSLVVLQ